MGRSYKQITLEERCQIVQLHAAGSRIQEIGAALDRGPSNIARELKRNGSRTKGYEPSYAQQGRAPALGVGSGTTRGGGTFPSDPGLVAGASGRPTGSGSQSPGDISHEIIYRFIYAQIKRANTGSCRHYLPRGNSKRASEAAWAAVQPQSSSCDVPCRNAPFCDTHSPRQQGEVENAIGCLRRTPPRKTDLVAESPRRFAQLVQGYNNSPRNCLDYQTSTLVLQRLFKEGCAGTREGRRAAWHVIDDN